MPVALQFTLVSNLSIKSVVVSNFKACQLVLQKEVIPEDLLGQCSEHLRNHNIADPSSRLRKVMIEHIGPEGSPSETKKTDGGVDGFCPSLVTTFIP